MQHVKHRESLKLAFEQFRRIAIAHPALGKRSVHAAKVGLLH